MASMSSTPHAVLNCVLAATCLVHLALSSQDSTTVPRTVYSIGDLHGDFDRLQLILEGVGLATFEGDHPTWTGGDSILVSTGDIVDRGFHSRPIYLAFMALSQQAPEQGGEVVNILGNHDLMTLQDDLRYVPSEELSAEGDYGGEEARQYEFSPEGTIGRDMRERYVVAAVRERTLFAHAGLHPQWLKQGLCLDNINDFARILLAQPNVTRDEPLFGPSGPLWDRSFAWGSEEECCALAEETLTLLDVDRMVVGHTPQDSGVASRCRGGQAGPKVILGDTVISRAYGDCGVPSIIEYKGENVTAIYLFDPNKAVEGAPTDDRRSISAIQEDGQCINHPAWVDCVGNGCWMYEANPEWCQLYGSGGCGTCGRSAVDACCVCKTAAETTTTTPPPVRRTPAEMQAAYRSKAALQKRMATASGTEVLTADVIQELLARRRPVNLLASSRDDASAGDAQEQPARQSLLRRQAPSKGLAAAAAPRKKVSRQAACSSHQACAMLTGECCPTSSGVMLDCCAGMLV